MNQKKERSFSFVMWLLFILAMAIAASRDLPPNLGELAVSDAAIVRLQEARP